MFSEVIGSMAELNFAGNELMQQFNLYILFNDNDTFKGVSLGNGLWYELADWNKMFIDLNPKDQNTGTNVTSDGVQTDYEPY